MIIADSSQWLLLSTYLGEEAKPSHSPRFTYNLFDHGKAPVAYLPSLLAHQPIVVENQGSSNQSQSSYQKSPRLELYRDQRDRLHRIQLSYNPSRRGRAGKPEPDHG